MAEIKVRPASLEELEQANWFRRSVLHSTKRERKIDALYQQIKPILDSGVGTATLVFETKEDYRKREGVISLLRKRAMKDGVRLQACQTDGNEILIRRIQLREVGENEHEKTT